MEFKLSPLEKEKAGNLYKKCKKKTKGKDVNLSYHFYPTGIGNKIVIKSETLGIEKDITDYNSW